MRNSEVEVEGIEMTYAQRDGQREAVLRVSCHCQRLLLEPLLLQKVRDAVAVRLGNLGQQGIGRGKIARKHCVLVSGKG